MALDVRNLKVYYNTLHGDVQALDDVSFTVKDGEILGIAGESGCGKSTLSNSLVYLSKPMEKKGGLVLLDDKELPIDDMAAMDKHRYHDISIIPQYALSALNPTMRIGKMVAELLEARGLDYGQYEKEFIERLKFVRLPETVYKRYPIELSGGMKQRVVMVISALLNPSLLMADEITSALDVSTQKIVAELIVAFRDEKFVKSVTFVTHDVPVLYQIADRIMIMYAGMIAEIGTAEEIIHQGKHPYTKALVAAMPEMESQYTEKVFQSIPGRPPALLDPPRGCRFKDRCPVAMDKCNQLPPKVMLNSGHEVHCWKVADEEKAATIVPAGETVTRAEVR